MAALQICRADYANPVHAKALIELLDAYARDPLGGGMALSAETQQNLIPALAARSQIFSILAFSLESDPVPVGLVNCIEGFSTFACQPLVNVHDLVVLNAYRGQGIAQKMLALVEEIALERDACKLTLEVLAGNQPAMRLYRRVGFSAYQLDPAMGSAQFLQKWLVEPTH